MVAIMCEGIVDRVDLMRVALLVGERTFLFQLLSLLFIFSSKNLNCYSRPFSGLSGTPRYSSLRGSKLMAMVLHMRACSSTGVLGLNTNLDFNLLIVCPNDAAYCWRIFMYS